MALKYAIILVSNTLSWTRMSLVTGCHMPKILFIFPKKIGLGRGVLHRQDCPQLPLKYAIFGQHFEFLTVKIRYLGQGNGHFRGLKYAIFGQTYRGGSRSLLQLPVLN